MAAKIDSYCGSKFSDLIISYLGDEDKGTGQLVKESWHREYEEADPATFVDLLISEGTFNFCDNLGTAKEIREFMQKVYPVLVDMASHSLERQFLMTVSRECCARGGRISMTATQSIGALAFQGGSSCTYAAKEPKGVQCIVELNLSRRPHFLTCNESGAWWCEKSPPWRGAAHELIHALDYVMEFDKVESLKELRSIRWTHGAESQAIEGPTSHGFTENLLAKGRGQRATLSHMAPPPFPPDLSLIETLMVMLEIGADGSAKLLCDKNLGKITWSDMPEQSIAATILGILGHKVAYLNEKIDKPFIKELQLHQKAVFAQILAGMCADGQGARAEKVLKLAIAQAKFLKMDGVLKFLDTIKLPFAKAPLTTPKIPKESSEQWGAERLQVAQSLLAMGMNLLAHSLLEDTEAALK